MFRVYPSHRLFATLEAAEASLDRDHYASDTVHVARLHFERGTSEFVNDGMIVSPARALVQAAAPKAAQIVHEKADAAIAAIAARQSAQKTALAQRKPGQRDGCVIRVRMFGDEFAMFIDADTTAQDVVSAGYEAGVVGIPRCPSINILFRDGDGDTSTKNVVVFHSTADTPLVALGAREGSLLLRKCGGGTTLTQKELASLRS